MPPPQSYQAYLSNLWLLVLNGSFRLVAAILILILGWTVATWARRSLLAGLARIPIDATLKPLLSSLVRYAILAVTFVLVVGQFGVQTTSLIALIGAAGIAVGLALQGTLSNVASGVMLLVLRPFRVGHFIETGGQSGTVTEIGLFTTILMTRDHLYVSIPNASIFGGVVTNWTRQPIRRMQFTLPVDIMNDLSEVKRVMLAAVKANAHVLHMPEPSVGVLSIGEYSVVMFVRAFIQSPDYWSALPSLQQDVKTALDTGGILFAVNRQAPAQRAEPASRPNTKSDDHPVMPNA